MKTTLTIILLFLLIPCALAETRSFITTCPEGSTNATIIIIDANGGLILNETQMQLFMEEPLSFNYTDELYQTKNLIAIYTCENETNILTSTINPVEDRTDPVIFYWIALIIASLILSFTISNLFLIPTGIFLIIILFSYIPIANHLNAEVVAAIIAAGIVIYMGFRQAK